MDLETIVCVGYIVVTLGVFLYNKSAIALFIAAYFAVWCGVQEVMIKQDIYEGSPALLIGVIYDYMALIVFKSVESFEGYKLTPLAITLSAAYGLLSMVSSSLLENYFLFSVLIGSMLLYEGFSGGRGSLHTNSRLARIKVHKDIDHFT